MQEEFKHSKQREKKRWRTTKFGVARPQNEVYKQNKKK